MSLFVLVGQALVGIVFIAGAVTDIIDRHALMQLLQRKNLRYPEYLLPGAIALKVVCSLGLIFNVAVPAAAFLLAGFTLVANVIFHPFWSCPPADRKREYFAFMVHLAVIGGMLVMVGK